MTEENKPKMSIRAGAVRAAIWENETEKGVRYPTISLSRSYREGEEWREAHTYNRDDLMRVRLVVDKALEMTSLDIQTDRGKTDFRSRVEEQRGTPAELELS